MKEKRVYVIPTYKLWEERWYRRIGIETVSKRDVHNISDDVWMDIAEYAGLVYTLEGFAQAWIDGMAFPSRGNNYARIIEVETVKE